MLQPRTYPELIGKALVLEAEPFAVMVDDDDPWAEGLFLVVTVGVLTGIARFVGGLLLTSSMPPVDAVFAAVLQAWQQLTPWLAGTGIDMAAVQDGLTQAWQGVLVATGYGGGWSRLLVIILAPTGLLIQWLIYGLISHGVASLLGGRGTINQTLGATALLVAPQVLYLLAVVPFVSISGLLLATWSLLITYRAIEVAHDLSWIQAAGTALAAPLILFLLLVAGTGVLSLILLVGGGA